jgi:HTH-type transcriptional regulator/antitoxin HigA
LNGKKSITAETAVELGDALGTSADVWLALQNTYRLEQLREERVALSPVARRARLRSLVPVRELQRRRWLPDTSDLDALELAVMDLLGTASLDERPIFAAAARRTNSEDALTPEQTAWISQVVRLARAANVGTFAPDRLHSLAEQLTRTIANVHDLHLLNELLADCGVVLVVVPPLRSSKIDGVSLILDGTPVVGLSARGDRMDIFVFTLLHELAHLLLGHLDSGDVTLDEDVSDPAGSERERDANELAAGWILPEEIEVSARPSTAEVLAAARHHGVHASVVVGRLQRDGRVGWNEMRRLVPKVRPYLEMSE